MAERLGEELRIKLNRRTNKGVGAKNRERCEESGSVR